MLAADLQRAWMSVERTIHNQTSRRRKLLALVEFLELIEAMPPAWRDPAVQHLDELSLADVINDIPLPLLERLLRVVTCQVPSSPPSEQPVADYQSTFSNMHMLREALARQYVWVGEPQQALVVLKLKLSSNAGLNEDQQTTATTSFSPESGRQPLFRAKLLHRSLPPGPARAWLSEVITEWEQDHTENAPDRLTILVLEGDGPCSGSLVPVRLRPQTRSRNTQLVLYPEPPPDDPAVQALVDAKASALRACDEQSPRAMRWQLLPLIRNTQLTGSSFGLAAAAMLYNAIQRLYSRNHVRFLRSAAITGRVAADGRVRPVEPGSVPFKTERAFFSTIETLVVPSGQGALAEQAIAAFRETYPNRTLEVVEVDTLAELLGERRFARPVFSLPITPVFRRAALHPLFNLALAAIGLAIVYFALAITLPGLQFWRVMNPDHGDTAVGYPWVRIYNHQHSWLWTVNAETGERHWLVQEGPALKHHAARNHMYAAGDVDGDGMSEVVMANDWTLSRQDSLIIRLLSPSGRTIQSRVYPPLEAQRSELPVRRAFLSYSSEIVDWDGRGYGRPVFSLVQPGGLGGCLLVELDPATLDIVNQLEKREWWLSIEALDDGHGREILWAGTRDDASGAAVLALFREGIPNSDWPPADTSGLTLYRFPIDPIYRHFGIPMQIEWSAPIQSKARRVAMLNPEFDRGLGAFHRFNWDGSVYEGAEVWDGEWHQRKLTIQQLRLPDRFILSRDSLVRYLSAVQRWTGASWEPLDPTNTLPDSAYQVPEDDR